MRGLPKYCSGRARSWEQPSRVSPLPPAPGVTRPPGRPASQASRGRARGGAGRGWGGVEAQGRGRWVFLGPNRARSRAGKPGGAGTAGLGRRPQLQQDGPPAACGRARREPRGAGGRGTPAWPPAPREAAPRDGTSSMSSGYGSSLEDSGDFFFTARTSFFRRAPQGSSAPAQQVSGVPVDAVAGAQSLPGNPGGGRTPAPRVSAGCTRDAREEGGGHRGRETSVRIPEQCLELVPAGLRACAGRTGERKAEGRGGGGALSRLPRQMASATPPRAAGG